jgi:hypothetical protein
MSGPARFPKMARVFMGFVAENITSITLMQWTIRDQEQISHP